MVNTLILELTDSIAPVAKPLSPMATRAPELDDRLKVLIKSTELVKIVSPSEVLLYDPHTERLRFLVITSYSTVEEFFFYHEPLDTKKYKDEKYLVKLWEAICSADTSLSISHSPFSMIFSTPPISITIHNKGKYIDSLFLASRYSIEDLAHIVRNLDSFKNGESIYRILIHVEAFACALETQEDPIKTLQTVLIRHLDDKDRYNLFKYLLHNNKNYPFNLKLLKEMFDILSLDFTKPEIFVDLFRNDIFPIQIWDTIFPDFRTLIGTDALKVSLDEMPRIKQYLLIKALSLSLNGSNAKMLDCLYHHFPALRTIDIHAALEILSEFQYFQFSREPLIQIISNGDIPSLVTFFKYIPTLSPSLQKASVLNIINPLNNLSVDIKLQILSLLLEHGLDPNFTFTTSTGFKCTVAEYYFYHNEAELALFLLQRGAKITTRIENKMKAELKFHPEYTDLLKEQGKITDEELRCLLSPPAGLGSKDSLITQMSNAKITLSLLIRRYASNPCITDFSKIEELRTLKKEVKRYLSAHPDDNVIKKLYDEFSFGYDTLVINNYVLSNLRKASKELRQFIALRDGSPEEKATHPLSNRVIGMFSLWHSDDCPTIPEATIFIQSISAADRSANWQIVRTQYLKALEEVHRDTFWRGRYITCVHGTKATPGMFHDKALIPMGMMNLEDGAHIAFSGERCGSMHALNKKHISCSIMGKDWELKNRKRRIFDAGTTFLTSVIYAKQVEGLGEVETIFDYESSKNRVSWEYISKNVFDGFFNNRVCEHCYTDILRLRAWDPDHASYLDPLLAQIRAELARGSLSSEGLKILEEALTIKIAHPLSNEDKDLISHPIPIVFASTTYPSIPGKEVNEGIDWVEVLIEGRAEFGRDIQLAFVSKGDLPAIADRVTTSGLRVYPLETAFAIEAENMMKGDEFPVLKDGTTKKISQQSIANALQADILTSYSLPLAASPSYTGEDGGSYIVSRPFWGREFGSYAAYKEAVEETTGLPRSIHGKMHAVRTSMAAQMWSHFYEASMGIKFTENRALLAIAAAAHDAERQDEGEDHWDAESGKALGSYLASKGYPKEVCDLYSHALIEKDPTARGADGNPVFTSDVQRFVHDADNIEILRVLEDKDGFRQDNLAFVQEWERFKMAHASDTGFSEKAAMIDKTLHDLINEWDDFIKLTENHELKMHLEYTPGINYYSEVMKILKHQVSLGKFPTIGKYLAAELLEITESPSADIIKMLS